MRRFDRARRRVMAEASALADDASSVTACRAFDRACGFVQQCLDFLVSDASGRIAVDLVDLTEKRVFAGLMKSPMLADSETRNLALPDQPVNRGRVDSQHHADFLHCQGFMLACHVA